MAPVATFCLFLLLCLGCRSLRFAAAPRLRSRGTSTSVGATPALGPTELEAYHRGQWDLFVTHHTGHFYGIQAGYDPEEPTVEDYLYCEQRLELSADGAEVKHVSSLVLGEIRADCETCFDSERLKSKDVGTYRVGKLKSRLCANVEVRGPGLTPRGISTEVVMRHGDGRVRVLLAHAPVEFADVAGVGSVPCVYALKDVVIVRERLKQRPLKADTDPDVMWVPTVDGTFAGPYDGTRERFGASGASERTPMAFDTLPACQVLSEQVKAEMQQAGGSEGDHVVSTGGGSSSNSVAADDTASEMYRRVFAGGILVEAPWVVAAGLDERARVSWAPCAGASAQPVVYAADIAVRAVTDVATLPTGQTVLVPPKLVDFFVDTVTKRK
jgi:hypothetical protein